MSLGNEAGKMKEVLGVIAVLLLNCASDVCDS